MSHPAQDLNALGRSAGGDGRLVIALAAG